MKKNNFDSYCGIYCGACDIMMAGRTGDKYKLASFWNGDNIKRYQKTLGFDYDSTKPVSLKCNGCKSDTLFVNCANCFIRKCAKEKNVNYCLDCGSYPCSHIVNLKKAGPVLPHIKDNHNNLERIREAGLKVWSSEQKKRWQCPHCQTEFSWYTDRCRNCGKGLKKYSYRFSFLQAFLLKLGISKTGEQRKRLKAVH